MICECCKREFFEDWRKDKRTPCRFCSRTCANIRDLSKEYRDKVSNTLKERFRKMEEEGRMCEKCGHIYHSRDLSRKMCFDCLPSTIKFNPKNRVKEKVITIKDVSSRTAEKIFKRMELPCSCCGEYVKGVHWDIHHIIPRKEGGKNDMDNLCYICPNCHRIVHTDSSLLKRPLVSLRQQLEECGKDWRDFYYG